MLAYRLLEWQQPPQLVEVDVPRIGPGEVLVKVAGNGLCHSDLTMMAIPGSIGEMIGWHMPFTLGHEVGGWIESIGADVTGFDVGQAVALVSPSSCGTCGLCLRGRDSACPHGLAGRGYGRDGGLAQFVAARAPRDVVPIGSLDPRHAAPLTDAGATSYHAVRKVLHKLTPGSTAVVIGAGGLGAFAVQILRALSPATVIAIDNNPARLGYATELGAHHTATGVDPQTAGQVRRLTNGEGATAVLDFVGIDATIEMGVGAVQPYGTYAVIGSNGGTFKRPWYGGLPRDGEVINFQGSSVSDAHEVVRLAEQGLIRSDADLFTLDNVAEAYDALHNGRLRGRAVVTPW
ncbi:MAG: alcohol dehydrogenase catalytic domain-containing protein [Actinobacteria bacterium]|nr:alcohol dehydrogenase catalytic domain-containing protein [Actinomycetota bacterium]